ncbi:PREDICTED: uncharacterized protein C2orf73 homolog [Charadrius vociferus]|uniref:uncharacterized protein C2orf73 homolog n=1 Tax=Charadrius vociferus TaxID=50402 RepID=UPI0005217006|nr:PREDICTED: uncharacterized protein C2orf73 homolog [Charadrius vociferus]
MPETLLMNPSEESYSDLGQWPVERPRNKSTWSSCVCRDKTSKWSIVPKGTEMFLSARGSCSRERPKTEKGNSVKSRMTSPSLFLQNS